MCVERGAGIEPAYTAWKAVLSPELSTPRTQKYVLIVKEGSPSPYGGVLLSVQAGESVVWKFSVPLALHRETWI